MSPKAKKDEETFDESSPYSWNESSGKSLDDFLSKYKPSMVQNDGTKPWLWVHVNKDLDSDSGRPGKEKEEEALEEAAQLLKEATEKIEGIKNDDSIPTRSNKKTGAKSKKEVREEAQKEYTQKLKDISQKSGYVHGKWLLFAQADKVDLIWSRLAKSIHSGPLAGTPITTAKVATSPASETPNYQHVICLYIPDVYDKATVESTMRILLRNHGSNLSGVKSDLYTLIGIDSKHPSGIQSTIWRNTDILKDSEIKELKEAFFKELEEGKVEASGGKPAKAPKPKAQKDDPFGSDDDEEEKPVEEAAKPKSKPNPKPVAKPDPFGSDSEDEEAVKERQRAEKLKKLTKPKAQPTAKRGRKDEESSDESDAPKAKAKRKIVK